MRELGLIAMASFRETVRDKILYTLLFFVLLLLAFAKLLGEWSVFDREKVVANFSLGVMSLGGLAIAIFIGIGLIQKEIQRKTILTLLSKPIHRWQFLVGKYLGLLLVLVINIVVMTIALFLVLHFSGSPVNARLLLASYETFWEMAVITAVALVFSSFSTPVASALLTFGVFLASHLSGGILQYLETMKKASEKIPGATPVSPVMEYAAKTARLILPDLEVFNIRAAIVHGMPLPDNYLLWSTLHGLGWTAFLHHFLDLVFPEGFRLTDAPRRLVVGVTGASGSIYAGRFLSHLRRTDVEVHLVASDTAEQVCAFEGHSLPKTWETSSEFPARLVRHRPADLFAAPASGSFRHDGMVVIPCSAGTVGRLSAGTSDSLLLRAADVCLKERRKLVLVVRETPLSRIHLRNLLELSDAGAVILPASPGFYQKPSSMEELVDGLLDRVFDQLGLPMDLAPRWRDLR